MSSTSQKHRRFVSEPIQKKSVNELAGVGPVLGRRLERAGYDKASDVLGQYLVMKRDRKQFQDWMKNTSNATSKQSADCYSCLNDWFENNS